MGFADELNNIEDDEEKFKQSIKEKVDSYIGNMKATLPSQKSAHHIDSLIGDRYNYKYDNEKSVFIGTDLSQYLDYGYNIYHGFSLYKVSASDLPVKVKDIREKVGICVVSNSAASFSEKQACIVIELLSEWLAQEGFRNIKVEPIPYCSIVFKPSGWRSEEYLQLDKDTIFVIRIYFEW